MENSALVMELVLAALTKDQASARGVIALSSGIAPYLGLAHQALGDFKAALTAYAQEDGLWFVKSAAHQSLGNQTAAIECLETAVKNNQTDAQRRLDELRAQTWVPAAQKVRVDTAQTRPACRLVSVYAKKNTRTAAVVDVNQNQAWVHIEFADGSVFNQEFPFTGRCVYTITDFKIELQLEDAFVPVRENIVSEVPAHPYAHKNPAAQLEAEEAEQKDDLQAMFRTIYADSDDDTKRAMMKSYQTSGGTVLSTRWQDVKNKNYEQHIEAPKGQEVHRWNDY